jgi:thiol reductant ABC exporter CydC subunit
VSALAKLAVPREGERGRLALSVALAAGATGAAIALLATSGYLISRAAQRPQIIALTVTIVAVRTFGISRAALRYAERLASHDLALRMLARLRTTFYKRLEPLVPGGLRGHERGELLSRFVSDVDTLQDLHLRIIIPALVAVIVIIGASIAGALMLGAAGAVLLATLTCTALCSSWVSARIADRTGRDQAPARAHLTARLVEAIDGSAELALTEASGQQASRIHDSDAVLAQLSRRDALAGALAGGLHGVLTGAGLLAVLVVGISAVHSGALASVLLAAVALLFLGACDAVAPLPAAARRLRACQSAATRLQEIADTEPRIVDPAHPAQLTGDGALALEHVQMRYAADEPIVLDGAELRIAPGEHVALVGPSGVGKTTLGELLVRFLDPTAGRVTLDGIDVRDVAQEELRRAVLICGQDAHLFNTTVRENLLIARREASDDELWQVLQTVELDAFVAGLPNGLDTLVGQQGELVSGGQRRRLALARALLATPRFLILDEPVAHLDGPLAERIMARIVDGLSEQGLLVITHETEALDRFDRVVTIEHGSLAHVDTVV